jgi:hypothetical protein
MEPKRKRSIWRAAGIIIAVLVVGCAVLVYRVSRRLPPEMMKDIRAGIAARAIPDAEERLNKYLELRYGPLDDPANREKVFVDFFNIEHIKALQLMVQYSPEAQRRSNILAMANWVRNYRESLTPAERAALNARFETPEGGARLRQATAQYNSQDVQYRGQTAAVISQLLKTISSTQQP